MAFKVRFKVTLKWPIADKFVCIDNYEGLIFLPFNLSPTVQIYVSIFIKNYARSLAFIMTLKFKLYLCAF